MKKTILLTIAFVLASVASVGQLQKINNYGSVHKAIGSTVTLIIPREATIRPGDEEYSAIALVNGKLKGFDRNVSSSWFDIGGEVSSVFGRKGNVVAQAGDYTTTLVPEGTNLYYREDRVGAFGDGRWAPLTHSHSIFSLTGFPSISGQSGKWLTTDGTSLTWAPITLGDYYTKTNLQTLGQSVIHWGNLTATPTTISGYGITDFNTLGDARWAPATGSENYIRNGTTPQSASFSINGTGSIVSSSNPAYGWSISANATPGSSFITYSRPSYGWSLGGDVHTTLATVSTASSITLRQGGAGGQEISIGGSAGTGGMFFKGRNNTSAVNFTWQNSASENSMTLSGTGVLSPSGALALPIRATTPAEVANGFVWYSSSDNNFKGHRNGVTRNLFMDGDVVENRTSSAQPSTSFWIDGVGKIAGTFTAINNSTTSYRALEIIPTLNQTGTGGGATYIGVHYNPSIVAINTPNHYSFYAVKGRMYVEEYVNLNSRLYVGSGLNSQNKTLNVGGDALFKGEVIYWNSSNQEIMRLTSSSVTIAATTTTTLNSLRSHDANGVNTPGTPLTLRGGRPTGSAIGGSVIFEVSPSGSGTAGGSTNITGVKKMELDGDGNLYLLNLASGGVPPTTNGSTRMVITDASGKFSHAPLPAAGAVIEKTTTTLDFPLTAAQSESDLQVWAVGASVGDAVSIGVPAAAATAGGSYTAWVSSPGMVTIRFTNHTTAAKNPAEGAFVVALLK